MPGLAESRPGFQAESRPGFCPGQAEVQAWMFPGQADIQPCNRPGAGINAERARPGSLVLAWGCVRCLGGMDVVERDADDEGSDEGGSLDEQWVDDGQLDAGGAVGGSAVACTDSELEVSLAERDFAMLGPFASAARLCVTICLSSFPTPLAGRGRGTIVGPARILSTGSEGAQHAAQAAQKNKHRVQRICAKRSLATAMSGSVDERESVAVGMLATAVSERARESM